MSLLITMFKIILVAGIIGAFLYVVWTIYNNWRVRREEEPFITPQIREPVVNNINNQKVYKDEVVNNINKIRSDEIRDQHEPEIRVIKKPVKYIIEEEPYYVYRRKKKAPTQKKKKGGRKKMKKMKQQQEPEYYEEEEYDDYDEYEDTSKKSRRSRNDDPFGLGKMDEYFNFDLGF